MVQGSFHRIEPDGPPAGEGSYEHAVGLLRTVIPETLTTDDPTAFRTVLFRIALTEVTGRLAIPANPPDAAER